MNRENKKYESELSASEGWIEWGGGECPVERGTIVDVKHRDGETFLNVKALSGKAETWSHVETEHPGDIIAYRLHCDINSRANDDRLEQDLNECIGQDVKGVALGFGGIENPLSGCASWNGSGIPPVGCACEYSLNSGITWFKCKIDYILGTQGLIMLADVFEGAQYVPFDEYDGKLKFRPLRTEEEKLAVADIIREMKMDENSHRDVVIAQKLYRAVCDGKIRGVSAGEK